MAAGSEVTLPNEQNVDNFDAASSNMEFQIALPEQLSSFVLVRLGTVEAAVEAHLMNHLDSIATHTKWFDRASTCISYLSNIRAEKVILILSTPQAQNVVAIVHDIIQVFCIYLFTTINENDLTWMNKYSKVHGSYSDMNSLVSKILGDLQTLASKSEKAIFLDNQNSSMLIYTKKNSDNVTEDLDENSREFIAFLFFVDVLLSTEWTTRRAKAGALEACRNCYKDNLYELKSIDELERNYSSKDAIYWYTKVGFLFRMMNKSMHLFDIELIFEFQFFITDLYTQLKQLSLQQNEALQNGLKVYRGKMLRENNLAYLQNNIGCLITIKSFLSTVKDSAVALAFAGDGATRPGYVSVIFEIDVDSNMNEVELFADVSRQSYCSDEEEVLFFLGCVFRIESVTLMREHLWNVKLISSNEVHQEAKAILHQFQNNLGATVNYITFGNVLTKLNKLDEAKKYYETLLKSPSSTNEDNAQIYNNLAIVYFSVGDYNAALSNCDKALAASTLTERSSFVLTGESDNKITNNQMKLILPGLDQNSTLHHIYYNIGCLYQSKNQYDKALTYFHKAAESASTEDGYHLTSIYSNIGHVYHRLGQFEMASENFQTALNIALKSLPPNHPFISASLNNLRVLSNRSTDNNTVSAECLETIITELEKLETNATTQITPEEYDKSIIAKKEAKLRDTSQNFIGVWLDENSERTDNKFYVDLKCSLDKLFDYTKSFTAASKFISYLTNIKRGKILFIVSHKSALKVLPIIEDEEEDFSQIHYIYIFCQNESDTDKWNSTSTKKYRGSFLSSNELIQQLKDDIFEIDVENDTPPPPVGVSTDALENEPSTEAISSISVFNVKITNNSIKELNKGSIWFIRYQLLFEILVRLEKSSTSKSDMIEKCQQEYKDNKKRLEQIKEFEKDVDDPFKSVYWYTKESFLIHLINKACGSRNVDEIYPYRLFIRDLHSELVKLDTVRREKPTNNRNTIVYRGKYLPLSTFKSLESNINGLISMNGFLSTSSDEIVVRSFACDGATVKNKIAVLFKLIIDQTITSKPFSPIPRERHCMKHEKEVLFSIGSIWRINDVFELENDEKCNIKMACIELTLSKEDDQQSVELADCLKREIGDNCSIWTLGDFLTKYGEYEEAENCYWLLEKTLPKSDPDRANIYNRIAYLRQEKGDPAAALLFYEKAMCYAAADSEICAAAVYNQQTIQNEASFSSSTVRRCFENDDIIIKVLISNKAIEPIILNNMGCVLHQQRDYISAIEHYENALKMLLLSESFFLREISAVHNNIGAVEYSKRNYSGAKEKFELAMQILSKRDSFHSWIEDYTRNFKAAQRHLDISKPKRLKTE